ncbi:DUF1214 domain-containing protein [Caulobacter sp. SLTY]|uniref:DUF1214 domain-containing protein n=1 Tax=Caulobacter sp. SLTY TaxID=2683262 RepID=UPI001413740D|nr:DUF1214 domain-containing protein [Caulobacter sp. SLTY]NBB16828.1 DUF1214 domain-containing protein [Caulobacter sp. SLTY]
MARSATSRTGSVLRWGLAIIAGLVVGVYSAQKVMTSPGASFATARGGIWRTSLDVGSTTANPYVRAVVARRGLLGLSSQETVYYNAVVDRDGQPLREACDYEVTGKGLPARWWSITLYAEDDFLARNADDAPSIDATSIVAGPDGAWKARISRERAGAANWVSSKAAGGMALSLRVYNPAPTVIADPLSVDLPVIRLLGCRETSQ